MMWRKLRRHKLAIIGGTILAVFYLVAIFADIIAPLGKYQFTDYRYTPPQRIHFFDENGRFHFRPFVYKLIQDRDPETLRMLYPEDKTQRYPIYFFTPGIEYKFWNLFPTNIHLFGLKGLEGPFLFGTDKMGRDLFTRTVHAARVSLSIGLVGVAISFILGAILGGISGYYGGAIDMAIQRVIEFLMSLPGIPLWMAMAAIVPIDWPIIKTYFMITVILSFLGWTGLARVVRGKLMSLKNEDFVLAAKISGASEGRIIVGHLLPSFLSYLIVSVTLAVPGMILGETALSFLGLGMRPPAVSWGTLLSDAQRVSVVVLYPWLLIPGALVVIVVLAFNFLGDGLRDAADPYKQ